MGKNSRIKTPSPSEKLGKAVIERDLDYWGKRNIEEII